MSSPQPGDMGVRAFLDHVAASAPARFPRALGTPQVKRGFAMAQFSFGRPKLHYEVWVQQKRGQIELGLHFEDDADLNGWLLQQLAPEMPAIAAELGVGFELEQWTKSWCRIHTYLPLGRLDESRAGDVAEQLAAVVACLQPRLEQLLARY